MSAGNAYGFQQLVELCKQTHQEMQRWAGRSVDIHLVIRNWLFGWYIVEYEQQGADRAEYGAFLVKKLSDELGKQLRRGFSVRSLEQCRKFYMTQKQIAQTVSAQSGTDENVCQLLPMPQAVSALSGAAVFRADDWQDVVTHLLKRFSLGWSHYVTLPKNANIFAPKYQPYLPSKAELKAQLEKITAELEGGKYEQDLCRPEGIQAD